MGKGRTVRKALLPSRRRKDSKLGATFSEQSRAQRRRETRLGSFQFVHEFGRTGSGRRAWGVASIGGIVRSAASTGPFWKWALDGPVRPYLTLESGATANCYPQKIV